MRVMMLSPYPTDRVFGGVEAVAGALVPALANHPEIDSIDVVSFTHGKDAYEIEPLSERITKHRVTSQARFELVNSLRADVLRATRLTEQIRPNVVHAQGIGREGAIAVQLQLPSVVTAHGMVHLERRMRMPRPNLLQRARLELADQLMEKTVARASVIISTSEYDRKTLGSCHPARVVSIPNPVTADFFEVPGCVEEPVILYAGQLIPRKNVTGIVRACARVHLAVPEARLQVVGVAPDPGYATQLQQVIIEGIATDSIELKGYVSQAELLSLLARCAVCVLFSFEETSPTVLAQAMAMGKPIVASRVGGVPELVLEGESGYLIDSGDEGALAERLIELLRNSELRQRMGRRAREMARERCHPDRVAARTVEAYQLAVRTG